jgi:hypothetical protein
MTNISGRSTSGCGVVFLALDERVNRQVALKIPRSEALFYPDILQRFRREAEAMARLTHPHIVHLFEAGESNAVVYIASEYCPGTNLAEWLQSFGAAPSKHAAMILAELAEALAFVHQHGILHRDLKPRNILLTRPQTDDTAGPTALLADLRAYVPKVNDFGLAKLLEHQGDETGTGATIGTASYMAPEQASGRRNELSCTTDVYGLGAILYELLAGKPPFRGANNADTLLKITNDDPIPPSRLHTGLDKDLEAICLKCLEKEPTRRYASAADLAGDLHRFLDGQPTLARRLGWLGRAVRWCRRKPLIAALIAAVSGLLATVAMIAILAFIRINAALKETTDALRSADEQAASAKRNLERARESVDTYFTQVSESEDLKAPALETLRKQLLLKAEQFYAQLAEETGSDSQTRFELARAMLRLAAITNQIESTTVAIRHSEQALALFHELVGEQPANAKYQTWLARSHRQLGYLYGTIGRTKEAETQFGCDQRILERLVQDYPQSTEYKHLLAQGGAHWVDLYRGRSMSFSKDNTHIETRMRRAVEIYRELTQADPNNLELRRESALSYAALARWYTAALSSEERREEIERLLGDALVIHAQLQHDRGLLEDERDLAERYYQLGYFRYWLVRSQAPNLKVLQPDLAPAEKAFREAAVRYAKLSKEHPLVHEFLDKVCRSYGQLGTIHENRHNPVKATEMFRLALPGLEKLVLEHPQATYYLRDLAVTYRKLGDQLVSAGQNTERMAWYAKSLECLKRWHERDKEDKFALQFLVDLYWVQGKALLLESRLPDSISMWKRAERLPEAVNSPACWTASRLAQNRLEHAIQEEP